MKVEIAKHVALVAFRSAANLTELVDFLREHCTEEEYRQYLDAIAKCSAEIGTSLLQRIYREHPEIEQEIDERIEKYGFLKVN